MSESTKPSISTRMAKIFRLGRSNDPLSSLKTITRWTDALVLGDPISAHAQILAEVKRFNDDSQPPCKDRLLILMVLDEKAQDLQATLVRQYLRNSRMSRTMESELWHSIYQLNWEILRGYHAYVFGYFAKQHQAGEKLKALVPIVTLRAFRGFRQLIKWRSIRYMPPGENVWARMHQLYQIAENQGFHKNSLLIYPNEKHESTCESEYLCTLMLDRANSGALYPRQIDLIDHWLSEWAGELHLERTLDVERHILSVDMMLDHGARRVRNAGSELSTRYWSSLELVARIKNIQVEIQTGVAPARLGLTENARVAESLELLSHLAHQWGKQTSREQRRKPRMAIKKVLEIVQGFSTIMTHISDETDVDASASTRDSAEMYRDEAMDMHVYGFVTDRTRSTSRYAAQPVKPDIKSKDIERWVMEDESECGYGTTIPLAERDWLRVGALLALRTVNEDTWSLGLVRRMSRLNDAEGSVGIETLNGKPLKVRLKGRMADAAYVVNGENVGKGNGMKFGLILNEGDMPAILLDPVHYRRKEVLQYSHAGEEKTIQLGDQFEQGDGWLMCRIAWVE